MALETQARVRSTAILRGTLGSLCSPTIRVMKECFQASAVIDIFVRLASVHLRPLCIRAVRLSS
jgi:hypothetical protein